MKKFIIKTALFTIPVFILFVTTSFLYSDNEEPDLLRLGYIPNIHKNYRAILPINNCEKFIKLSAAKKKKYKVMTIGDSFSEQGANGYKNFLANDFKVLHIDRFISKNPIQTLINLSNSDFFNHYDVEYVILQNVERHVIDNIKNLKMNSKIPISEIDSLIKIHKTEEEYKYKYKFFSRTTIEFPLYYLPKYFLDKNFLSNKKVYNYNLNSTSFFSNSSNKLLFYYIDFLNTPQNNDIINCQKLNSVLNSISITLKEKNIILIFLPSPDKYDLYFDFIVNKNGLPKPIFYDNFKSLKKNYLYIDAKSILSEYIYSKPDLYYYDDTHWSPIASKIIANKIKETINNDK